MSFSNIIPVICESVGARLKVHASVRAPLLGLFCCSASLKRMMAIVISLLLLTSPVKADGFFGWHDGSSELTLIKTYTPPPSRFATGLAGLLIPSAPTAVAWSDDGTRLAAFSEQGQDLTVWDAKGDTIAIMHPYMNYLHNSLAFLNDNELLTPPEGKIKDDPNERWALDIWDIQKGSVVKKVVGSEPGKDWGINSASVYALSPDRTLVAALAQQTGMTKFGPAQEFKENPVPIYSTKTWEIVQRLPVVWPIALTFSPDGKQIAFGTLTGKIILYDTATWLPVRTISACREGSQVSAIAYSPDGKFIVAGVSGSYVNCSVVRIFRVDDGTMIADYPGDYRVGGPWAILWHPSGKFIVFAPHDKTLRVWKMDNLHDSGTVIHGVNSMCLAFSPDGKQLASCNSNGISLFNIKL